ncbi:hypothetical protein SAMN04489796_11244 [Winogradskyella thalassocola]|uniref:Outer membrane protein beta-barrel domain-containing protein n=2 Tax=Winogradskyella thalassocola TaxID=262004 RepID=A0A1G8L660_9FLAO|nr:hypothetical protein SAMN04489796_11244 [Winogradskyella thalassocola]
MYASITRSVIVLLLFSTMAFAQEKKKTVNDTLVFKQKYGLRLGTDISKLARTFLDDDYSGFEIMGDYRLTKRIYIAGEIGNEERILENEILSNTTKGSYFKAGFDMNFYQNWLDMENMVYAGFRIGASSFNQTRNSYTVYDINNQYWGDRYTVNEAKEYNGLTALWTELQIGLKAEIFNNFFAGFNIQLKVLITEKEIDDYENLYIPGYNRTYDSSSFGGGFGFNLSYLVPIFKKDKIVIQEKEVEK